MSLRPKQIDQGTAARHIRAGCLLGEFQFIQCFLKRAPSLALVKASNRRDLAFSTKYLVSLLIRFLLSQYVVVRGAVDKAEQGTLLAYDQEGHANRNQH